MKNQFQYLSHETPLRIGRYVLGRELGRGFSSVVYEATDALRGRSVALKVLTLPQSLSPERRQDLVERFVREARAVSALAHPGIVAIYEIGQAEDGQQFIAMQHLAGETLRARLLRDGTVPPRESVGIAAQIADALEYANGRGIIHRDVKPDNVFLQPDGTAKLMDFGVAHVLSDETLTQTGTVVGSPAYMSPEQIHGLPLDARTDVFSLGVTLVEMLRGHKPFEAANIPAVMNQIMNRPPQLEGLKPRALRKVIGKSLAKNKAARYDSPAAFAQALRRLELPAFDNQSETATVVMAAADFPRPAPHPPTARFLLPGAAALLGVLALTWGSARYFAHSARGPVGSSPGQARPAVAAVHPAPADGTMPVGRGGRIHIIAARWHPVKHEARQTHASRPQLSETQPKGRQPQAPETPRAASIPADVPVVRTAAVKPTAPPAPAVRLTRTPPAVPRPPVQVKVSGYEQERRPDPEQSQVAAVDAEPVRGTSVPDAAPSLVHQTAADYPTSAQAAGQSGTVRLRVFVNEEGDVTGATVIQSSGVTALDSAAVACVRHWAYNPAFRDGQVVPGVATARVVFRLD